MSRPVVVVDHACSVVALAGLALACGAVLAPARGLVPDRAWADFTIYPWWSMVLVTVGAAAAVVSLAGPPGRGPGSATAAAWLAAAPVVTALVGVQVAGLGVVAVRHWLPAFGMGGGYSGGTGLTGIADLERLALLVALGGASAASAGLAQLLLRGLLPGPSDPSRPRGLLLGAAVVVGVVVPVLAGRGTVTSAGAAGLIHAGPWALALVVAAVTERTTSRLALGALVVSVALGVVGPSMTDLLGGGARPAFAGALLLVVVAAVLTARRASPST